MARAEARTVWESTIQQSLRENGMILIARKVENLFVREPKVRS